MNNQLNISERNELERCEVVIKQGLQTFVEVGQALMLIRDKRLYRAEFGTFDEYCQSKWQMQKAFAYRLIGASEVVRNIEMSPIGDKPQTESQARPLTKLEPEIQREAWQQVVDQHGENITQKKVQEVVKEFVPINNELKQAKKEPMFAAMTEQEILAKAKEIKNAKQQDKIDKLLEAKKKVIDNLKQDIKENVPDIYYKDCFDFLPTLKDNSFDLLITDPPYSTDVNDIYSFAKEWVNIALKKVKKTGRVYICTGAYPKEVQAYLDVLLSQKKFIVDNPLIWTYRNTLGRTPNMKYNLNYQVIFHLYSLDSPPLDTSITNEMFSVQDINAPDGRLGDRFHTWQKPDKLGERLIRHSSKAGDRILDCFACTGTFLLMAAKMNREAVGCDNSKENLQIAKERGCNVIY